MPSVFIKRHTNVIRSFLLKGNHESVAKSDDKKIGTIKSAYGNKEFIQDKKQLLIQYDKIIDLQIAKQRSIIRKVL